MRVLQVLSYMSADGAYGGPVAVARAQSMELARRGHQVQLVTAWDGATDVATPGVRVHAHRSFRIPGTGFAGLTAPGAWRDVRRLAHEADVVHLHYARDLVQLPAEAVVPRRVPTVLQTHGMVRPDGRLSARSLDRAFTRSAYRRAGAHLCLTDQEVADVPSVAARHGAVVKVRNGVPVPTLRAAFSERPRVVFIARLHERKRPVAFVDMAATMIAAGSPATFHLHGPDEGEAEAVVAQIAERGLGDRVAYEGPLEPSQVGATLAAAQAYVLPSVREVFPMSLLEAMSHGLPSIITDDTGLSDELAERGSALVTDGSPSSMARAVEGVLSSSQRWQAISDRARRDIAEHFSPSSVAEALEDVYRSLARR